MAGASEDESPVGLVDSLFDRVRDIVGDAAGHAMFHYAAYQEGERIGSQRRPEDIRDVLDHLDRMLGQRSDLVDAGPDPVVLDVHSRIADSSNPVLEGVVLGMLEGALGSMHGARYEGHIGDERTDGTVRVTLKVKTT